MSSGVTLGPKKGLSGFVLPLLTFVISSRLRIQHKEKIAAETEAMAMVKTVAVIKESVTARRQLKSSIKQSRQ